MSKVERISQDWIEPTPLTKAVTWATEFINDLGGDFGFFEIEENKITLRNKTACPGFCSHSASETTTCNNIERAINQAIKTYDCELTAGFLRCSTDEGSVCELVIRLDL